MKDKTQKPFRHYHGHPLLVCMMKEAERAERKQAAAESADRVNRPRCEARVDNPRYPCHTDKPTRKCGLLLPCKRHAVEDKGDGEKS